jgi:hypothetical protein
MVTNILKELAALVIGPEHGGNRLHQNDFIVAQPHSVIPQNSAISAVTVLKT